VNIDSSITAAITLLSQAKDNGGGLELRDIFGPAAEAWRSPDQIMARVARHERLQWCLRVPALLEVRRRRYATGEAFIDLLDTPSEFRVGQTELG
jgi:hypothetical protein